MSEQFWQTQSLNEMSESQWESLCDGCARCCMVKLQDEDDHTVHYTAVVCDLLDLDRCRCTRYPQRHELVPDCVELDAKRAEQFSWLPNTCAYRVLANGGELAWWHPLVSGSQSTVHEAGISVRDKVVHESQVHADDVPAMIVHWVEQ